MELDNKFSNYDLGNIEYQHFLNTSLNILNKHAPMNTAQKMFSIMHIFSKCDQLPRKLRISSHLLKKSLMENFIFCPVQEK